MLVTKRALVPLLDDLRGAADAAARARRAPTATRRSSAARCSSRPLPTTFGLKAAGWMAGLDEAAAGLRRVRLAAQLGGPAGTLAGRRCPGSPSRSASTRRSSPGTPLRGRIGELAGALGVAAGAVGKAALDVILLAQTEVGEVREAAPRRLDRRCRTSTTRSPRSPRSAARKQAPGLVATLLAAMVQEHERAAGAWHASGAR